MSDKRIVVLDFDLTPIAVLVVLSVAGFFGYRYYCGIQEEKRLAAEESDRRRRADEQKRYADEQKRYADECERQRQQQIDDQRRYADERERQRQHEIAMEKLRSDAYAAEALKRALLEEEARRLAEEDAANKRLERERAQKASAAQLNEKLARAKKDIKEFKAALEKNESDCIAWRNKLVGAKKSQEAARSEFWSYASQHGYQVIDAGGEWLVNALPQNKNLALVRKDCSEECARAHAKFEGFQREETEAQQKLNDTTAAIAETKIKLAACDSEMRQAANSLRALGVRPDVKPEAAGKQADAAGRAKIVGIYKLANGTVIAATTTAEIDDNYMLRDEDGKIYTVAKVDVIKIERLPQN